MAYASRRLAARAAHGGGDPARAWCGWPTRLPRRGRGASRSWRARLSPRVLEAPARLDDVRRELDEYFEGRRDELRPADRLVAHPRLHPRGAAGHRADRLRRGRAPTRRSPARPAARAPSGPPATRSGANPMPVVVPCHRVLRTGGALGGYTGGHRAQGVPAAPRGRARLTAARLQSVGSPERWPSG